MNISIRQTSAKYDLRKIYFHTAELDAFFGHYKSKTKDTLLVECRGCILERVSNEKK